MYRTLLPALPILILACEPIEPSEGYVPPTVPIFEPTPTPGEVVDEIDPFASVTKATPTEVEPTPAPEATPEPTPTESDDTDAPAGEEEDPTPEAVAGAGLDAAAAALNDNQTEEEVDGSDEGEEPIVLDFGGEPDKEEAPKEVRVNQHAWGMRLISTIPDIEPPRAVIALASGREVVVEPGTFLVDEKMIVMAVSAEGVEISKVTPEGARATLETQKLVPLSAKKAEAPTP